MKNVIGILMLLLVASCSSVDKSQPVSSGSYKEGNIIEGGVSGESFVGGGEGAAVEDSIAR